MLRRLARGMATVASSSSEDSACEAASEPCGSGSETLLFLAVRAVYRAARDEETAFMPFASLLSSRSRLLDLILRRGLLLLPPARLALPFSLSLSSSSSVVLPCSECAFMLPLFLMVCTKPPCLPVDLDDVLDDEVDKLMSLVIASC